MCDACWLKPVQSGGLMQAKLSISTVFNFIPVKLIVTSAIQKKLCILKKARTETYISYCSRFGLRYDCNRRPATKRLRY